VAALLGGCALLAGVSAQTRPGDAVLRSAETRAALEYRFEAADGALLDEIQHASFEYFWKEVGQPAQLVRDRKKAPVASIAAVGFQLAALPIAVERGWVARSAAEERGTTILKALAARDDNRKFGVYLHYPDLNTGGMSHEGFEILASTVDHALFLAGAITAGEYFEGDLRQLARQLVRETDWRAFAVAPGGFLSMGWKPADGGRLTGPGHFLDAKWDWASDEERLIYFLAVGSPDPNRALPPELYYRLKRTLKRHGNLPPLVVSWPGNVFTYVFSHCWIDYRSFGADEPARFGVSAPRVDWFENSRRAMLTHRQRCIEQSARFRTLSAERWGLSACAARDGYIVPEVRPNASDTDNWFEGTVAPYASLSAMMFTPVESLAAARALRGLQDAQGRPLIWKDPQAGGYGFVDSFNLDQDFVCDDYVGIDQGPLLLGIENARSGLIWRLFMKSATAEHAVDRLGWRRERE
jgi:hypothetical protein